MRRRVSLYGVSELNVNPYSCLNSHLLVIYTFIYRYSLAGDSADVV